MTTYTAPPGRGNIHGNPGGDGGNNIDPGLGPVQNPDVPVPTSAQLRNDPTNTSSGNIHGNPGGGGGNNIDPGLGPVQNPDVTVPTSAQLRNDLINMGSGHSDLHINGGADLDQNPGALLGVQLTNEPHQWTNVVGIQYHPEYPGL